MIRAKCCYSTAAVSAGGRFIEMTSGIRVVVLAGLAPAIIWMLASEATAQEAEFMPLGAHAGSVSLDRTVYPVPFGVPGDFVGQASRTSYFPIHATGLWTGAGGLDYIAGGDLVIHVRVTDPDFDTSASSQDKIAVAIGGTIHTGPVKISVIRGSDTVTLGYAGGPVAVDNVIYNGIPTVSRYGEDGYPRGESDSVRQFGPMREISSNAGVFEADITIRYTDGPAGSDCPLTTEYAPLDGPETASAYSVRFSGGDHFCILRGDMLLVEYNDPTDASGNPAIATDSATFDMRNAVLQSDKSEYLVGTDMILTLIEPDFDLDSDQAEKYDLDLIEWDSDAATITMGDRGGNAAAFDPEPTTFRETGDSTGIFQTIIEIPESLDGNPLSRGEAIRLEYTDWGPTGADYVGQEDEDVSLDIMTTDFGATIKLDQKVYTWTDKVYITIIAPDYNYDGDLADEIGYTDYDTIRISTRDHDLNKYKLVETGTDTGIFTGEVILSGFASHDADGDGDIPDARGITGDGTGRALGIGPTNGFLETTNDDRVSVSFEYSEDITIVASALIRWNIGEVRWLESSYPASGTGVVQVIDPDLNINPEAVDNFDINVWSDTDAGGIDLTVTETDEATGIFAGTVAFSTDIESSGHRLRITEGDTVTAEYEDRTLPGPYTLRDDLDITATTLIGTPDFRDTADETTDTISDSGGDLISGHAEVTMAEGSSVPGCEEDNECFIPHTVTIGIGGEVKWSNVDVAAHTATSGVLADGGSDGVFDSGLFVPGAEFSHIFEEAGEYPYFCTVHPWRTGLVVVGDAPAFSKAGSFDALARPVAVATAEISGRIYALVASADDGDDHDDDDYSDDGAIQIIDITDPADPIPAASVFDGTGGFDALAGAEGIAVHEFSGRTYALVTGYWDDGLQVIDVTDPEDPTPAASVFDGAGGFDALAGASDVAVVEASGRTYALVTGYWDDGLQVIDVTDPEDPTPAASVFDGAGGFDALAGASDVAVVEASGRTYALVTGYWDDGLQVIDVTDPEDPTPAASVFDGAGGFDALAYPEDIAISRISGQTYALVAGVGDYGEGDRAVQIMDVTDPADPLPVASIYDGYVDYNPPIGLGSVAVVEASGRTYALVTGFWDGGLRVVDVTDPADPLLATSILDGYDGFDELGGAGYAGIVEVSDRIYAIVAGYNDDGIQIMDITNPESPIAGVGISDFQMRPDGEPGYATGGDIITFYREVDDPGYYGLRSWLMDNEDQVIGADTITDYLALPYDIHVDFELCGESNAYYYPATDRITMCYELVDEYTDLFREMRDSGEETAFGVANALHWVFLHEMGHAVIDIYDLPITGQEENVADQFATVMMLREEYGHLSVWAMAAVYASGAEYLSPFWDTHALDAQRFYNMACMLYGKHYDDEIGRSVLDVLPEGRAVYCPGEYATAVSSWERLLADYLRN